MINLFPTEEGTRIEVRVQPRSSRTQVAGEIDGALKIKLTAPPVEGEANQALVDFLARLFKLPKRDILIVKGETSRTKLVEIRGVDPDTVQAIINK
ncbi:DUF167 domain-containing protein [Syntrophomonas erecta]